MISHEIRTPINSISLGCAILLKTKSDLQQQLQLQQEELYDIVTDIKAASDIANRLVSDLLEHDKIEDGIMQLDLEDTNVWKIFTSTVKLFRNQVCIYFNIYIYI